MEDIGHSVTKRTVRGTLKLEHTFAQVGAQRLWYLLQTEDYIAALGAMSGNQAVQQVEIAYRLDVNEFRGQRSVQLVVEHLEPVAA